MTTAFKRRNVDAYAQSIADYLPNDPLFAAKNVQGSNLRKFINGLSYLFYNTNGLISEYVDSVSPLVSDKFVAEWERAVGIPDSIFSPYEDERIVSVTSLTSLAYVATATTSAGHGYVTGTTVKIRGAVETQFNVTAVITVTGPTTFTYTITSGATVTATGTITSTTTTILKSNADRCLQIIAKLSYKSCQTAQDFIDLAALFGYTITITPGIDDVSGATTGLSNTEKRFTIVVNATASVSVFPLTFTITFGGAGDAFLQSLLTNSNAANTQILYNFV